jgi:iron complex outermembrane receptor protein
MSIYCHFRHSAIAAGCAICLSSYAQVAEPTPAPEIVVTGNAFQSKELSIPVERLSGDALLTRQASTLGETLSGLPGVSSTYFGSVASRPIIRGLDGDRIRILNNGAVTSDASNLSFDHATTDDPLSMESVEIVRGPASLLYGGSAVGGVVNVLDGRIARKALFGASGGTLGKVQLGIVSGNRERSGGALLETGTDKFALHVDGFSRKSDATRAPHPVGRIANTQAQSEGGAIGGSMLFDHGYLGASWQLSKPNYGSPAEVDVTIKMHSTRMRLEGEHRAINALGGLVQGISGHIVQHQYQHEELDLGVVGTTFKSKGNDAKLQARLSPLNVAGQSLQTVVGVQRESLRFVADGTEAFVPKTNTHTNALYALQEMNPTWGKLSFGLRREVAQVESFGSDTVATFIPAKRTFGGTSAALGSVFKLDSALKGASASIDLSRSSRIPKDYELYADGEHVATAVYERGDQNLAVEKSTHLELGLRWQGERRTDRSSLNIFTTHYDNYIYLRDTGGVSAPGGNPIFQFTATTARFQGWEWQGAKRVIDASAGSPRSHDLEARIGSVQATNTVTGAALPRIAPKRIGLDWTTKQNAWTTRLGVDYNAPQNQVAATQPATTGYTFLNASVNFEQKTGTGRALWFARIDNATNKLAYPASSILTQTAVGRVPLPGRSLKLGVQFSF